MIKNAFHLFIVQLLTIPLVIGIFNLPAERAVLSIGANIVFWIIALITLSYKGPYKKFILFSGLQFLITSVLPVTILRFLSWGGDFNTSSFFGIMGSQWHSYSNKSFTLMILISLVVTLISKFKNKS